MLYDGAEYVSALGHEAPAPRSGRHHDMVRTRLGTSAMFRLVVLGRVWGWTLNWPKSSAKTIPCRISRLPLPVPKHNSGPMRWGRITISLQNGIAWPRRPPLPRAVNFTDYLG